LSSYGCDLYSNSTQERLGKEGYKFAKFVAFLSVYVGNWLIPVRSLYLGLIAASKGVSTIFIGFFGPAFVLLFKNIYNLYLLNP
jgi:hypothetical protein